MDPFSVTFSSLSHIILFANLIQKGNILSQSVSFKSFGISTCLKGFIQRKTNIFIQHHIAWDCHIWWRLLSGKTFHRCFACHCILFFHLDKSPRSVRNHLHCDTAVFFFMSVCIFGLFTFVIISFNVHISDVYCQHK